MGYDTLSMSVTNLAPVKSALRRFSRAQAMALLAEVAHMDDARAIRACVEERLRREGVPVRVRI